ncbi:hypothetical protein PI86_15440 [Burkholderia sp. A9]|uniref:hypothetical protein n=1 Tax=Burkholderia sp. A9 TaxID=1365108 RepID=UPI000575B29E|nr:hypothetical protein [Burkholderia sp. A9]KHK49521.1 hypothetical protein PI86_15440 [Burkholderia sp. A9]
MRNPVFLLVFALIFSAPAAQAGTTENAWCRAGTIAAIRQQALSESHTARARGAAARAAYDTLKPAIDAGCLTATYDGATPASAMTPEAIAYAWLLTDASVYLIAAGSNDDATRGDSDNATCLDVLLPLIRDNMRPRSGLPHGLHVAVAANVQQCSAHCVGPSCRPTNMSAWSAYRSEAALYTRRPSCRYDARLVQLSADTCVGFDGGAYRAPHTDQDAKKLTCDASSSTSIARCPALLVLTREQGKGTIRRFAAVEHSALSDPSTACTVRSTGVNVDGGILH